VDTPTDSAEIQELLIRGKSLAFNHMAQSIFFVSEVYHKDGKPILGKEIPPDSQWGIQVIGSTARGNSFHSITTISGEKEFEFDNPDIQMGRESKFEYPFAKFFHIQDEIEMSEIIECIENICSDERKAIVNMMAMLKSLFLLGYHK